VGEGGCDSSHVLMLTCRGGWIRYDCMYVRSPDHWHPPLDCTTIKHS
jgi:hypothetical protein